MDSGDCFPRGGIISKEKEPDTIKNLFHVKKQNEIRIDETEPEEIEDKVQVGGKLKVDRLTYSKIRAGMLILGCIHKIKTAVLQIELPGRLFGKLLINSISTPFSKLLQFLEDNDDVTGLDMFFKVGEYIPTKVVHVEKDLVNLSTNPCDVNAGLRANQLKKGMLVWGAILEKNDHGYVVDLGIKHCRAHLNFANVDVGLELRSGKPLYTVILNCKIDEKMATLQLSAESQRIANAITYKDANLAQSLPGVQVKFTIAEFLSNGLKGTCLKNHDAMISSLHYHQSWVKKDFFKLHEELNARLMYADEENRRGYFMLKSLEPTEPKLAIGKVLTCKIINHDNKAVVVSLEKIYKGLIAYNRIYKTVNKEKISAVKKRYRNGFFTKCVLLDYNYFTGTYNASFNIKETPTVDDVRLFTLGQKVTCVIKMIKNEGVCVKVGVNFAFIPSSHLDVNKDDLNIGDTLEARVWNIIESTNRLYLTCKQALLNDKLVFGKESTTHIRANVLGIVERVYWNKAIIGFYGDLKAKLPKTNVKNLPHEKNLYDCIKIGDVVNCQIENVNKKNQLILSMALNKSVKLTKQRIDVEVGELKCRAKVIKVKEKGLVVSTHDKVFGLIPVSELAASNLGIAFLETYKPGDVINNLICIKTAPVVLFSIKTAKICVSRHLSIPTFEELQEGMLLRCFYSRSKNGCPLFDALIFNNSKDVVSMKWDDPNWKKGEEIVGKILQITDDTIEISTRLLDVCTIDFSYATMLLKEYLDDVHYLEEQIKTNLKIGQCVEGVILEVVDDEAYLVNLPDIGEIGFNAYIPIDHSLDTLAIDEKVKGIVIWLDYVEKRVIISLKPEILLSKKKNVPELVDGRVNVIYSCKDVAVGYLPDAGNQLALLPIKLHENHHNPNPLIYKINTATGGVVVKLSRSHGIYLGQPNMRKATRWNVKRKSDAKQEVMVKRRKNC